MNDQIKLLFRLSLIDQHLDELREELGDLPVQVKQLEDVLEQKLNALSETVEKIKEIEHLNGTGHVTILELNDKETKLSSQQFKVRNNKEFDAITKQIEFIKNERAELEEKLRTIGVTDENQHATRDAQQAEVNTAQQALNDKRKELEVMQGDTGEELKKFINQRLQTIAAIDDSLEAEYERIRTFHHEAIVSIRRDSCSGCFSAIPSQRIMEMKHNHDKMYTCENCGRILVTEDVITEVETAFEEENG